MDKKGKEEEDKEYIFHSLTLNLPRKKMPLLGKRKSKA